MKQKNFLLTMVLSLAMVVGLGSKVKAQGCTPPATCGSCFIAPCGAFPIIVNNHMPSCDACFAYVTSPCNGVCCAPYFCVGAGLTGTAMGGCVCVPDCGWACAEGMGPAYGSLVGSIWSTNTGSPGVYTYLDNSSSWALACCPNGVKYVLTYTSSGGSCSTLTIDVYCN